MTGDRAAFFDNAASFTPIVAADVAGATFLVSTSDTVVGRILFTKRTRSELVTITRAVATLDALLPGVLGERATFVDVGANIGTATVMALRTGRFHDAVACEPEMSNVKLLQLNLVLNEVAHRATVLPVAVSDENGTRDLALHTLNSGGHEMVAGSAPPRSGPEAAAFATRVPVEAVTLDYLAERGLVEPERVGLVWVDVQGHEGYVLRGARTYVRRGTPFVVEVCPLLLRRAGCLPLLVKTVVNQYTHFVDLREDGERPHPQPSAAFPELVAALESNTRGTHTDVLLLNQEP